MGSGIIPSVRVKTDELFIYSYLAGCPVFGGNFSFANIASVAHSQKASQCRDTASIPGSGTGWRTAILSCIHSSRWLRPESSLSITLSRRSKQREAALCFLHWQICFIISIKDIPREFTGNERQERASSRCSV